MISNEKFAQSQYINSTYTHTHTHLQSYPGSSASPYSGLSPMDDVADLPSPIPDGPTGANGAVESVVPVPTSSEEPPVTTSE